MAVSANNIFSVSGAYSQSARVLCYHPDTKQTGAPTTTQPCRPSSVACTKPSAAQRSSLAREGPTRSAQHTAQMASAWLQLWLWDTARMKDGHPLQTLGRPLFEPKSGPDTHQSPSAAKPQLLLPLDTRRQSLLQGTLLLDWVRFHQHHAAPQLLGT